MKQLILFWIFFISFFCGFFVPTGFVGASDVVKSKDYSDIISAIKKDGEALLKSVDKIFSKDKPEPGSKTKSNFQKRQESTKLWRKFIEDSLSKIIAEKGSPNIPFTYLFFGSIARNSVGVKSDLDFGVVYELNWIENKEKKQLPTLDYVKEYFTSVQKILEEALSSLKSSISFDRVVGDPDNPPYILTLNQLSQVFDEKYKPDTYNDLELSNNLKNYQIQIWIPSIEKEDECKKFAAKYQEQCRAGLFKNVVWKKTNEIRKKLVHSFLSKLVSEISDKFLLCQAYKSYIVTESNAWKRKNFFKDAFEKRGIHPKKGIYRFIERLVSSLAFLYGIEYQEDMNPEKVLLALKKNHHLSEASFKVMRGLYSYALGLKLRWEYYINGNAALDPLMPISLSCETMFPDGFDEDLENAVTNICNLTEKLRPLIESFDKFSARVNNSNLPFF